MRERTVYRDPRSSAPLRTARPGRDYRSNAATLGLIIPEPLRARIRICKQ